MAGWPHGMDSVTLLIQLLMAVRIEASFVESLYALQMSVVSRLELSCPFGTAVQSRRVISVTVAHWYF